MPSLYGSCPVRPKVSQLPDPSPQKGGDKGGGDRCDEEGESDPKPPSQTARAPPGAGGDVFPAFRAADRVSVHQGGTVRAPEISGLIGLRAALDPRCKTIVPPEVSR